MRSQIDEERRSWCAIRTRSVGRCRRSIFLPRADYGFDRRWLASNDDATGGTGVGVPRRRSDLLDPMRSLRHSHRWIPVTKLGRSKARLRKSGPLSTCRGFRQACDGPGFLDVTLPQPRRFVEHGVQQAHTCRQSRWGIHRQVETGRHANPLNFDRLENAGIFDSPRDDVANRAGQKRACASRSIGWSSSMSL
jgi:hypothetical protein